MPSHNEWWQKDCIPSYMEKHEELSSIEITVQFFATLTPKAYKTIERDFSEFSFSISSNVISVTGYDSEVLSGDRILNRLRQYDRNARRVP